MDEAFIWALAAAAEGIKSRILDASVSISHTPYPTSHIPWTLACALSHVSPFAAVMFYWWVSQTKIDDASMSSFASLRRCEEQSGAALLFPLLPPANGENLFKTSTQLHPLTARPCNRRQRSWRREIDVLGINRQALLSRKTCKSWKFQSFLTEERRASYYSYVKHYGRELTKLTKSYQEIKSL